MSSRNCTLKPKLSLISVWIHSSLLILTLNCSDLELSHVNITYHFTAKRQAHYIFFLVSSACGTISRWLVGTKSQPKKVCPTSLFKCYSIFCVTARTFQSFSWPGSVAGFSAALWSSPAAECWSISDQRHWTVQPPRSLTVWSEWRHR